MSEADKYDQELDLIIERTRAEIQKIFARRADLPSTLAAALAVPEVRALELALWKARAHVVARANGYAESPQAVEQAQVDIAEIDAALAALEKAREG